jgi:hypothetical protein
VIQRQISIERAAPWLVSGVSGLYILVRARHLSLAEASDASLARFLFQQSDLMLMLCGCPVIWHFVRNRRANTSHESLPGSQALAMHRLREVLTALMLGTGLLARKIAAGKIANLAALAMRLNKIAHDGADVLDDLDDSYRPDLLDQHNVPIGRGVHNNGIGV